MDDGKPYTMDDLALAMADWKYAQETFKGCEALAGVARQAMDSHLRDAEGAKAEVDRHRARVNKIIKELGK